MEIKGFECIRCGFEFIFNEADYVCPKCGGNLQVVYDYRHIRKNLKKSNLEQNSDFSIWRYGSLLPVENRSETPVARTGGTPLYRAERLGKKLGLSDLYVKDEGRNPSASFKDRASAVLVVKAQERGENIITCASTGNAASSLSCLAAPLGLKTIIFVPWNSPAAKITQLLVFGAHVITVKGSYDDAFDLCKEATGRYGWYNRNTGYNPFTREGKKTCSYEMCEQMGWESPDKIFVPVADGNIISGVWKGFVELYEIGFIDRFPQLIACQAEKHDSIKRAFESNGVIARAKGKTIADSLSVEFPRDGDAAVKAIIESKGSAISVSDKEILDAIPVLARESGVFGEPAGVASLAALQKAIRNNMVHEHEKVVLLVTGNGLKDIDSAMKSGGKPVTINPDTKELERIVSQGLI